MPNTWHTCSIAITQPVAGGTGVVEYQFWGESLDKRESPWRGVGE